MKTLLIAASCLSMLAPAIVEAQNDQQENGKPAGHPQKPAGNPHGGGNYRPGGSGGNGQPNNRTAPRNGSPQGSGNYHPGGGQPNNRPAQNYGGPNRPAPNYSGNYNGRPNSGANYRGNYARGHYGAWNGQHYHGGYWNWPHGYGYQRWWIGGVLPALFLSQAYWFNDYANLGFGPPPYGCAWVRYGPDLLLVNIDTGQILDVEYGVFA
ncbi:MAG TPA: RcnB family protein [Caulobacteraceae bacterium]|jgi:Ni/Co efflux regulator RcnB